VVAVVVAVAVVVVVVVVVAVAVAVAVAVVRSDDSKRSLSSRRVELARGILPPRRVGRTRRRHKATFVGLGAMGLRHMRVFAALGDRFEMAGAFDVRPDAPVPDGTLRLRDEEEAIERADVVIVASPTRSHAGIVARALAAARHVLVEKPLCSTAAEARAVAEVGGAGAGRLFVGHTERFNPVVRVLARLLRDEPLLAIDLTRVGPAASRSSTECGALVNLGVHDFDLAAYLGRSPVTIRGAVGDGDDLAHVLFTSAAGAVGHLHVDRSAPAKRRSITVTTPRWLYEGDLLAHGLVRSGRGCRGGRVSVSRTDVPLPLDEPLAAQALALADALDGAAAREIATGDDGACAVALAEEASSRAARQRLTRKTCRRPRLAGTP
jgi:predicted dehydrogenase